MTTPREHGLFACGCYLHTMQQENGKWAIVLEPCRDPDCPTLAYIEAKTKRAA